MEKLARNHPRFCAKYIKEIGIAKEERIGWCRAINLNGTRFIYQQLGRTFNPGDKVLIAKRIPHPGNEWTIHEIILAEDYWTYEYFMDKTAKEQRTKPYEPRAHSWFGRNTYIVEEASLEYIKRNFGWK